MSNMSISGSGLSATLLQAMNDLSRDLRAEQRTRATEEANRALAEGLAEAASLHDKADEQRTGALVGAAITGLGASAQLYAAAETKIPGIDAGETERASIEACNRRLASVASAGSTVSTMGKIGQDAFDARAADHDADARAHAAKAQAATRAAEVAESAAQDAKQIGDKARDAHAEILALEHASRMAALRG